MLGRLDYSLTGVPIGSGPVPRITEGSAFRVTLRPMSEDLAAIIPTSMRYRIDDVNQGSTILDWTSLTPATSVNVVITGAQNAIRNNLCTERRQIVFEASDSDGAIRRTFDYDITDIQGITT
jgi:hypothetical protein